MPGLELINKEELKEIKDIFRNGGVLFRHGFEKLRNNTYKVQTFEEKFSKFPNKIKKYRKIFFKNLAQ